MGGGLSRGDRGRRQTKRGRVPLVKGKRGETPLWEGSIIKERVSDGNVHQAHVWV